MLLAAPVYCPSRFTYTRRRTREVQIGTVAVGGTQPIRVQSMTTTRTQDIEATLAQTIRLVEVGCEIVRITAPTVTDSQAIGEIKRRLDALGIVVPLVAKCKARGVAMRIGSNHGSLSDRIMNRHGDTPAGMVESALEFVRIARKHDYHDIVLSMKASNPKVMIQAYRLLVARMDEEGLDPYPLHLGVTEAGLGEDGRIKSAIGIGALLDDGLGDTVRVSLTEEPEAEVPVAMRLVEPYNLGLSAARAYPETTERVDPYSYSRRLSSPVEIGSVTLGGGATIAIVDPPEEALLNPPDGEALSPGRFDSSVP